MIKNEKLNSNSLKSLSRADLNRLVQRHLFIYDMLNFRSFIKKIEANNIPAYAITLSKIQEGVFGYYGDKLKRLKNVPIKNTLPDFMSPMELLMYREAINRVIDEYDGINKKTPANCYYSLARQIGEEVNKEFRIYLHEQYDEEGNLDLENEKQRRNYYDKNGVSLYQSIIKKYKRSLKLGKYKSLLLTSSLIKSKRTNDFNYFDPYSKENFDRYEMFRQDFVCIVNMLKDANVSERVVKELFQAYEKTFFNTNYLKDKNVNIVNYLLGLNKGICFSYKNFKCFEASLFYFHKLLINIDRKYSKFTNEVVDEIKSRLTQKAEQERTKYIQDPENIKNFCRPENSNVFLVACLDNITKEVSKEKDKLTNLVGPNNEFLPQNIQKLSIFELAKMVAISMKRERSSIEPTFKKEDSFQLSLSDSFNF
ncbi:MAG: hypothetical protein PHS54_05760 [Clostridia bacterium]|nr:hypothetical protein [Clostridia bacterium]